MGSDHTTKQVVSWDRSGVKKKNAWESFLGFRCRKTVPSESPVVFKNSGFGFSKKIELVGVVGSGYLGTL